MIPARRLVLVFAVLCAATHAVAQTDAGSARFALPAGQACADVPFALIDNRAVYSVRIAGQGPFRFVFDTGANTVMDEGTARALGMDLTPHGETGGAGAGTQRSWTARLAEAAFGGVTMTDSDVLVLDLSAIRTAIGFERLDGLMGREALAALLVRYDYDRSLLTFCDPDAAPAAMRHGTPVPFRWQASYHVPVIAAEIDGRRAELMIDTGDRSSLTVFGPYADKEGLRAAYRPLVRAVTGRGVGGPIPADVFKAGQLRLGGFTIPGVTARIPALTSGGFATDLMAGSIGSGVMRRFTATYDYRAHTIYLAPNAAFGAPDRFDRSGLWISGHRDGFEVLSVVAGSGADRAGIAAGDILTEVDGLAATVQSLIAVRDRWMDAPPGTRVRVLYKRKDGEPKPAILILSSLI